MIKIFEGHADDFSGQGLGYISPIKAEVHGVAGGEFEIELEVPIDDSRDDWVIDHQRIISAPAPVRTSPEVNFGITGEITRFIVKATSKVKMYNRKNRKKVLKSYKKGTKFIRLEVDGSWYKVSTIKGGTVGWMKSAKLDFDSEVEDVVSNDVSTVVEEVVCKDQLFRIYNIIRDVANLRVKVRAEHITYDLKGVIVDGEYAPEDVPADEVLAQILAKADQQDLPFDIYCGCTDLISGDYTGRNIIDCILNGDDGIAAQCNARVVRDNYSIYILPPEDRYLGVDIRYGDNLIKANAETDSGSTITRIKPVGKNKKGKPLYITENDGYVDSPYASKFAVQRTKRIEYNNVQTGKGGLSTDAKARKRLTDLALEEFEKSGIVSQKIDAKFVRRELTEEYKALANEAALHMYDIAKIKAARAGVVASVRMTEYVFDALPGRERYIDTKISDIVESEPMVYGVNIANNSVSGTKIVNNTLSGDKIKDLSVGIGKFDVATIDQLNANSITAITANIQQIVSEKITTDELYAAMAEMIALKVGTLTASDIETDRLAAAMAAFTVITAKTADFDQTTIKHLVSNAMNLNYGVAGEVFIENLQVLYGQMVEATIGNLCIKAEDGNYYNIGVDESGNVTATKNTTITDGEISAGQTGSGRVILETHITAESLNTGNLLATYALINKIDAARIDVAELFANEAFIGKLITTDISSNSYIQQSIIDEATGEIKKFARLEDDGLHVGGAEAGCDVVINDDSVNVRVNGQVYSKFASNYAQFGGYQIRSSAGGGLIFKVKR